MRRAAICVSLICAAAAPAGAADPFLRRTAAVQAVEKVGPAVVSITTERVVQRANPFGMLRNDPFFERFFQDFFTPRAPSTAQSLGSGVIIDPAGHVLTNEHVVNRADRIRVALADGREFDAALIGADPNNDLAVLRVETTESLPWVEPGRSDDLLVGEPVIAIGNPFGLESTVTTGVISALDRSYRSERRVFHGFLQTDASINPGNSGGPLLNAEGSLIGINTAIYQGGQGIGFAIPIDVARRIVSELIEHGQVSPVWIGIDLQEIDPQLSQALELPSTLTGVLINRVREDTPAQRAGIRRGDVLLRLDRRPVTSARDFFEMLQAVTDQQPLQLSLWRDGTTREVELRAEQIPERAIPLLARELLGLDLLPSQGGGYEILAVNASSAAARIGLQRGDLLLGVNGLALKDADALRRAVLDLRGRQRALVVVQRGGYRYSLAIPLA